MPNTLDMMNDPKTMEKVLTLIAVIQELGNTVKVDIAIWVNGLEIAEVKDILQSVRESEPEPT